MLLSCLISFPVIYACFSSAFVNAANILVVTTTPFYGSQTVLQPIWKELSLRGHKVTAITPNPIQDPRLTNLTEINIKFIYELLEMKYDYTAQLIKNRDSPLRYSAFFLSLLTGVNKDVLAHPDVQALIKDPSKEFDLVIVEFIVPTMLAFGHRFKCPVVAITSMDASVLGHDAIGNPNHPALNPDPTLKFNVKLSFMQRVFSTLNLIIRKVVFKIVKQIEDETVANSFGPNYPRLEKLTNEIDLFLMNVNPAFHNFRPTVPAVVHFGGEMSIKPSKPLPVDVKQFLDDGKDGVIYFSLGTVVKVKTLTSQFLESLFVAFSKLPYQILVKLDIEEFPEIPSNIIIRKWVSQQDVLRHPNVKAFITQCGLQSIEEAIYYNVPIVGIPFFGDQFSNCIQAHRKGLGWILDSNNLDAGKLQAVIYEVIQNPAYEQRSIELAKIATDQPMSGLEKAVWWIEYVLRHEGAEHLRFPALDIPLWKFYLFDVVSFILVIFLILLSVIYLMLRKCLSLCGLQKKKDVPNKIKTQ